MWYIAGIVLFVVAIVAFTLLRYFQHYECPACGSHLTFLYIIHDYEDAPYGLLLACNKCQKVHFRRDSHELWKLSIETSESLRKMMNDKSKK